MCLLLAENSIKALSMSMLRASPSSYLVLGLGGRILANRYLTTAPILSDKLLEDTIPLTGCFIGSLIFWIVETRTKHEMDTDDEWNLVNGLAAITEKRRIQAVAGSLPEERWDTTSFHPRSKQKEETESIRLLWTAIGLSHSMRC